MDSIYPFVTSPMTPPLPPYGVGATSSWLICWFPVQIGGCWMDHGGTIGTHRYQCRPCRPVMMEHLRLTYPELLYSFYDFNGESCFSLQEFQLMILVGILMRVVVINSMEFTEGILAYSVFLFIVLIRCLVFMSRNCLETFLFYAVHILRRNWKRDFSVQSCRKKIIDIYTNSNSVCHFNQQPCLRWVR